MRRNSTRGKIKIKRKGTKMPDVEVWDVGNTIDTLTYITICI